MSLLELDYILKGGPGSGSFGHKGRPGKVGGGGGGRKTLVKGDKVKITSFLHGTKVNGRMGTFTGETREGSYGTWYGIKVGKFKKPFEFHIEDFTKADSGDGPAALPVKEPVVPKPPKATELPSAPKISPNSRESLNEKFVHTSANNLGRVDQKVLGAITRRSGVDRDVVHRYIASWNGGGARGERTMMMEAVNQELGIQLSGYEKKNRAEWLKDAKKFDATDVLPEYRKITRAIYNETQEKLKAANVTEVTLHRGMKITKSEPLYNAKHNSVVEYDGNVIDSWTIDPGVARDFMKRKSKGRGFLLTSTIPVTRIFSTPTTGSGTRNESEFVVLGSDSNDNVHVFRR